MTRMVEELNETLRVLLASGEVGYLMGEDLADPYGGAFRATAGLSTAFPDRVLSTPISESGFMGAAAGLALAGDTVVVEVMFADFLTLAFDVLVNFAAKAVSMYGRRLPMRLVVRAAGGAGRGYGPTHSQRLEKHLMGVPDLHVYEMSPYRPTLDTFREMLAAAVPCVFVEDKRLYGRRLTPSPARRSVLTPLDEGGASRTLAIDGGPDRVDWLVICGGGMVDRVQEAVDEVFIEEEISARVLVPTRLYPVDTHGLGPLVRAAERVLVVEESSAGGTWGSEVADVLHRRFGTTMRTPVQTLSSADCPIPAAVSREAAVVVGVSAITKVLKGARTDGAADSPVQRQ